MNKLLIVENDHSVRASLVMGLSDCFVVMEAESAGAALELLEREQPDVILLDQHMQAANGTTLLEKLSRMEHRPGVVLYSASMDVALARQALWLGAQDCLSKPFSLQDLKGKLDRAAQVSLHPIHPRPFAGKVADLLVEGSGSGETLESGRKHFVRALMREALLDAQGDADRAAGRLDLSTQEFNSLSENF